MKVTVLYGGPSAERDVSLISGQAVIEALQSTGHDVFPSDISPSDLSGLDHPCDVVFPVLHGEFGESGELQDGRSTELGLSHLLQNVEIALKGFCTFH